MSGGGAEKLALSLVARNQMLLTAGGGQRHLNTPDLRGKKLICCRGGPGANALARRGRRGTSGVLASGDPLC